MGAGSLPLLSVPWDLLSVQLYFNKNVIKKIQCAICALCKIRVSFLAHMVIYIYGQIVDALII